MKALQPWIRKIATHLQSYDQVPLFGHAPSFDWDRFSVLLASRFGVKNLSIRAEKQQWRSAEELKEGLGGHVLVMPLKVGPLEGSAFWMMPREEIAKFTSWMMHGQSKTRPLSSEILSEGFYRYLLLQALDVTSGLDPMKRLAPLLSEESPMPESDALCVDIEIEFEERSCWGRLAIEPTLHKSWISHFAAIPADYIPSAAAKSVELTVGVKVGSSLITQSEWGGVQEGDVLLLDRGGYDPRKSQGAAYFMLGSIALFQVKVKHNKLEFLDYATSFEEEMDNKMKSEPLQPLPPVNDEVAAIKEVPLQITVELVRMRITLEKLMQLAPGNVMELPIQPEQGVNLSVNGQVIARAELVHLGEALGVRILEKG